MAGDTPTPIRHSKEGTRFDDAVVEIDFRKGSESLKTYDEVKERRRVQAALEPAVLDAVEPRVFSGEFTYPPKSVQEVAILTQELIKARTHRRDPSEVLATWDVAA